MSAAVAQRAGALVSRAWATSGSRARHPQKQSAAAASSVERRRPGLRRAGLTTTRARARAMPVGALAPEEEGNKLDEAAVFTGASRGDKAKQLEIQDLILACETVSPILEIVGSKLDGFSHINGVTALYRIARSLTSRGGRLRRKEASFVVEDRRFLALVDFVEAHSAKLDRVGLENRKWAYHKLMLPSEYRSRAAHAVRQLDRAKDLQGDLLDAIDVETILVLVEDAAEIFNKVNVSTAVHRVARLATTKMNGVVPVDVQSLKNDARFRKLMELVETMAPEMAVVSVANALWAMARLQWAGPESTVDALARRAARECVTGEPRHLSTVMWALAVLGHEPRSKLLAAVGDRAVQKADGFKAPDIVNMLWAYARWHRTAAGGAPCSVSTVDALCAVALRELHTFTPYQCANLAWSLAMLEVTLPNPRALGMILDRAAQEPGKLDPTALTHTLWAIGVKGTEMDGNSGAFQTLLAEAARRASTKKIGRTGAAGVVWACGRLRVTPRPGESDALLGRLLGEGVAERGGKDGTTRPLKPLESQALVHAVWGVSQMDGVTMSEPHRAAALEHATRLTGEGKMPKAHAEALRQSAAGAGLDPRQMEAALAGA